MSLPMSSTEELTMADLDVAPFDITELNLDAEEKQKMLEMTSTAERLQVLIVHLNETIRKLQQQIAYKEVLTKVRGNGDLGNPKRGS